MFDNLPTRTMGSQNDKYVVIQCVLTEKLMGQAQM